MAALPRAEFIAEPVAVGAMAGTPGVLAALVEHAAVITGENHEGMLGEFEIVEGREDLADHPVEFVNAVPVASAVAGALETRVRGKWVVDLGGGEVEEERGVFFGANPSDGFFGQGGAEFSILVERVGGLATGDGLMGENFFWEG